MYLYLWVSHIVPLNSFVNALYECASAALAYLVGKAHRRFYRTFRHHFVKHKTYIHHHVSMYVAMWRQFSLLACLEIISLKEKGEHYKTVAWKANWYWWKMSSLWFMCGGLGNWWKFNATYLSDGKRELK